MSDVRLARGEIALIDPEDYERISKYKWYCTRRNRAEKPYARCTVRSEGKVGTIFMHHLVLPKKDGLEVDHINGNSLDNRRCNLRYATTAQNQANQRKVRGVVRLKGV